MFCSLPWGYFAPKRDIETLSNSAAALPDAYSDAQLKKTRTGKSSHFGAMLKNVGGVRRLLYYSRVRVANSVCQWPAHFVLGGVSTVCPLCVHCVPSGI
jgi:hypothetical protein